MKITIDKKTLDDAYNKAYRREEKYQIGVTGFTDIANDIGEIVGIGAYHDESWYFEGIWQAEDYAHEHFNFEDALLKLSDAELSKVEKAIEENGQACEIPNGDGVHTQIASYALSDAVGFASLLNSVKELDRETLAALFSDYEKELEEARDAQAYEMRREFIRGDYHGNYEGIERHLAKLLQADSVDVDGFEAVTIEWEDEEARRILEDAGMRKDLRLMKSWTIDRMISKAKYHKDKRKAESDARKAERERVAKYQAERKAEAERERLAKIDKIRI